MLKHFVETRRRNKNIRDHKNQIGPNTPPCGTPIATSMGTWYSHTLNIVQSTKMT